MFRNFIIHQIFFEFLQTLRDFRIQRVSRSFNNGSLRSFCVFFLICIWNFTGLIWGVKLIPLSALLTNTLDRLEARSSEWFWIHCLGFFCCPLGFMACAAAPSIVIVSRWDFWINSHLIFAVAGAFIFDTFHFFVKFKANERTYPWPTGGCFCPAHLVSDVLNVSKHYLLNRAVSLW